MPENLKEKNSGKGIFFLNCTFLNLFGQISSKWCWRNLWPSRWPEKSCQELIFLFHINKPILSHYGFLVKYSWNTYSLNDRLFQLLIAIAIYYAVQSQCSTAIKLICIYVIATDLKKSYCTKTYDRKANISNLI